MNVGSDKKNYALVILTLALIGSIGLCMHIYLVLLPQAEASRNNLRIVAFNHWLDKMTLIKDKLKNVTTCSDARDVSLHTYWAEKWDDIISYSWVRKATAAMHITLMTIGNRTGVVTEQDIDQNILLMLANMTRTIENIKNEANYVLIQNGVEPAQQFQDAGILTNLQDQSKKILVIAQDIDDHYY